VASLFTAAVAAAFVFFDDIIILQQTLFGFAVGV